MRAFKYWLAKGTHAINACKVALRGSALRLRTRCSRNATLRALWKNL